MEQSDSRGIVKRFLEYLTKRDVNGITSLFAENVDWYIPGDIKSAPWLGKRNTRSEVKSFFELLWPNTEPVSAEIDHIFFDEPRVVVAGSFKTKMLMSNKIVESPFFIHMKIENNRICWYRLLEDSFAVSVSLSQGEAV